MKKDSVNENKKPVIEPIVIADECGDSLWDEVLQQEVKACDTKVVANNTSSLFDRINEAQVNNTSKS